MGQSWDAGLYEAKHSFVWRHGLALVDLLQPVPGERILDLGCGTGHLTAELARRGAEVVGLDHSPAMIGQARAAFPQCRFEVGDARAFVFAAPFDAVLSNAVLHWVREPERVIACVRAALRPGGRFVAELGGRGNVRILAGALEAAAASAGGGPFVSPWYFPSLGEYAGLLERGGLEVTQALLLDRPTPLQGKDGLRNWVAMFAGEYLAGLPTDRRDAFLQRVEEAARPALCPDGTWFADYRRLRLLAWRRDE